MLSKVIHLTDGVNTFELLLNAVKFVQKSEETWLNYQSFRIFHSYVKEINRWYKSETFLAHRRRHPLNKTQMLSKKGLSGNFFLSSWDARKKKKTVTQPDWYQEWLQLNILWLSAGTRSLFSQTFQQHPDLLWWSDGENHAEGVGSLFKKFFKGFQWIKINFQKKKK